MSAGDGSERGGISSNASDQKAEEEERYRLKIVVLQEYYDAIALVCFFLCPNGFSSEWISKHFYKRLLSILLLIGHYGQNYREQ